MELSVRAEARIHAPPRHVYRFIADFRRHHPHFLPSAFRDLVVEHGGVGAGTVHRFELTIGGRTRRYRSIVQEPLPGTVLTESDARNGTMTTFTVIPDVADARVQIETRWKAGTGVAGIVERLVAPRMLRGALREELRLLDRYAIQRCQTGASAAARVAGKPGTGNRSAISATR
jgi:hypothetical protein